ncbi:hypothetical protein CRD59_06350 [Bifidobacterium xylocopae]|uniref:Fibronectin type-III domain-containing protein n=2 Tax=Bifidobacterium xylocopae TaxID=2493119 RepID=A0A366KB49_9BIFI|nr:hypothetical protein CRD59_06350 [Bifidobacterium xylocopae]
MADEGIVRRYAGGSEQLRGQTGRRALRLIRPLMALLLAAAAVAAIVLVRVSTRQERDLDDGTVWVASADDGKLARFNPRIRETDAVIRTPSPDLDFAQSGGRTVVRQGRRLTSIDPVSLSPGASTPVAPGMRPFLAAGTLSVVDERTGRLWVNDARLPPLDPARAQPAMELGAGGRAAMAADGSVYGYRPDDGTILALEHPDGPAHELYSLTAGHHMAADALTVVQGRTVVLSGRNLFWRGGRVHLPGQGPVEVQAPPVDQAQSGSWVAAADRNALFLVDLDRPEGGLRTLATGSSGRPAQPVSSGDCLWAAWASRERNFTRLCGVGGNAPNLAAAPGTGGPEPGLDDPSTPVRSLDSIEPGARLVFRTNKQQVVLNDTAAGTVWNPQRSGQAIRLDWNSAQERPTRSENHDRDQSKTRDDLTTGCKEGAGSVTAKDDRFGIRAGGRALLDPLANDQETGCALAAISQVSAGDRRLGMAAVAGGRYLQVDAAGMDPGRIRISYTVDDGRGHSSSAGIILDIVDTGGNRPPAATGPAADCRLEAGGSVVLNALDGFTDPDGDPLALQSARVQQPAGVSASMRGDGRLELTSSANPGDQAQVQVTATDGRAGGSRTITCPIAPAHSLPALADPVVERAPMGQDTDISVDRLAHGSSDQPLRLDGVQANAGITAHLLPGGTALRIHPDRTGDHYLPYTVSQGGRKTQGVFRVEAFAGHGGKARPVTADDVAILDGSGHAYLDPLANDSDPAAGPLTLADVDTGETEGVKAGIADHGRVHIEVKRSLERPLAISYRAANGAGSSRGVITILPQTAGSAAPTLVAEPVHATVRSHGSLSIPVLDHVHGGATGPLSLSPKLSAAPAGAKGHAFVSGQRVRFLADGGQGHMTLTYTVTDPQGGQTTGSIDIDIHPDHSEGKPPSQPRDLRVGAQAGRRTRVEVDLTGIDPDGDDLQLIGLGEHRPRLGRIVEFGGDWLTYEAYPDANGQDGFDYQVEDWTGRRSQGHVRVGVTAGGQTRAPMARDDHIQLRPGVQADLPVTANDLTADGLEPRLDSVLPAGGTAGLKTRVVDGRIRLTSPDQPCERYLTYTVRDHEGAIDQATLRLTTSPTAPILPPLAAELQPGPNDRWRGREVSLDVRGRIANPSGPENDLRLGLGEGSDGQARLEGGPDSRTLIAVLGERASTIPYTVTNARYGLSATGLIHLPAYGDMPPALKTHAHPLHVKADGGLTITLSDWVQAGPGQRIRLASTQSVTASRSDGSDPCLDQERLRFRPARGYSGPASISFTIRSEPPADSHAGPHQATLTIPIEVDGGRAVPPVLSAAPVDVEAGGAPYTLSLRRLTVMHGPAGTRALTYASPGLSGEVTARLTAGGALTLTASRNAPLGKRLHLPLTIRYPGGRVETGLTVRIVASRRPLASLPERRIALAAGRRLRIDALEGAFNPFPDQPLSLVKASSDTGTLSVRIHSGGWLELEAKDPGEETGARVSFTVADASGAQSRRVSGTIIVDFLNHPRPPTLLAGNVSTGDGSISLSWRPGEAMGSPILEYRITYQGPGGTGTQPCGQATSCTVRGLSNGQVYSLTVRSRNAQGWSPPSAPLAARPDVRPEAPQGLVVDGTDQEELHISWRPAANRGSRVTGYQVSADGPGCGTILGREPTSTQASMVVAHQVAGRTCTVSVEAGNMAGRGPAAAASGATWSSPDAPDFGEIIQGQPGWPPGHVEVRLRAGDPHGRPCQSVDLTVAGVDQRRFAVSYPCKADGSSTGGGADLPADLIGRSITLVAVTRTQARSGLSPTARRIITLEGRRPA